jgi:hypothetical protein
MSSVWDDPRAEKLLRRLAEDGQPASAIAAAMCAAGHFASRNAVIGKCMRIGLQLRGNETRYAAVRASAPAKPATKPRRAYAAPVDDPVKPEHDAAAISPPPPSGLTGGPIRRRGARLGGGVDAPVKPEHDGAGKAAPSGPAGGVLFTAVGRDACRWPVAGEGLALRVCGASAAPGRSYCPACCRLAYEPQALRPVRPPHEVARRARRPDEARAERTGDMLDEIGEAA